MFIALAGLWVIFLSGHEIAGAQAVKGTAIAYLGVFGSVVGFALYYYVIKHMEAGKVALITLVTPVLALLLGNFLNGEVVTLRVWLGAGLIMLGLMVYQMTVLLCLLRRPSQQN